MNKDADGRKISGKNLWANDVEGKIFKIHSIKPGEGGSEEEYFRCMKSSIQSPRGPFNYSFIQYVLIDHYLSDAVLGSGIQQWIKQNHWTALKLGKTNNKQINIYYIRDS